MKMHSYVSIYAYICIYNELGRKKQRHWHCSKNLVFKGNVYLLLATYYPQHTNKQIILLQGHHPMQNIYNKLADKHMYVCVQMYNGCSLNLWKMFVKLFTITQFISYLHMIQCYMYGAYTVSLNSICLPIMHLSIFCPSGGAAGWPRGIWHLKIFGV